ncbi:MAG: aldo/keto reductase [Candidatus Hydrogenedentota bacterium]
MEYRRLGDSELDVSVLAFGAWQIGDPNYWGPDGQADADAVVKAAMDAGINFFDTAEGYGGGESERQLGKALGNRRKNVYVASKVSPKNCAPGRLRQSCEASLQRLRTDYLDLYQVHWPFHGIRAEDVYEEFARLQEEGKIRYIGVSNFGPTSLLRSALQQAPVISNQIGYNLIFRAIEYEILPMCQRHGLGVLAYMPLMQGLLAGRWSRVDDVPIVRRRTRHFASSRQQTRHQEDGCEQLLFQTLGKIARVAQQEEMSMAMLSLAWLMARPGVSSVIVGCRHSKQLERNVEAVGIKLRQEVIDQLDELTRPIKEHLGANADMWLGGEESRIQ